MTASLLPSPNRCAQLKQHQPLVRRVASRLRARLPSHVDVDDLVQSGMMGLDNALDRYEPSGGASFETYASRRIEGAMLDGLRQLDEMPREARTRHRLIRLAVQKLEHLLGRAPRAQEVAKELDWSLSRFHDCMAEAGVGSLRSSDDGSTLEDIAVADLEQDGIEPLDESADPLHAVQQRQRHAALSRAFDTLEAQERRVMEMLYEHDASMREVGAALGVSAPRICQIHEQIVIKLRRRLRDW